MLKDVLSNKHKFIFVGLRPSISAWKFSRQWSDGAYAGKQLKDALEQLGFFFDEMVFINLYTLPQEKASIQTDADDLAEAIRKLKRSVLYWTIVGMGKEVQKVLDSFTIEHLKLIHPAARGKIRKKYRYLKHCKEVLKSFYK